MLTATAEGVTLTISGARKTLQAAVLSFAGGGPRRLRVLLEGEALLNDASSFTLFEIFLELVEELNQPGGHPAESGWVVFGNIVKSALKLGFGAPPGTHHKPSPTTFEHKDISSNGWTRGFSRRQLFAMFIIA